MSPSGSGPGGSAAHQRSLRARPAAAALLGLLLLASGLLAGAGPRPLALVVASEEPGGPRQRLLTLPASTGESFVVAYTHSLNHFPIRETVTIEQSQSAARHLVVTGQAVRGDGAGIGEVPGETRWAAADDGWHRLTGLHRVVDDGLVLRVGHVAGHRLVHRHRVLALGDLAPGGARLVLAPEEVSPLAWLHGTVMWRLRGAATSGTTGDDRS